MDFRLTADQREIQALARDFARAEIELRRKNGDRRTLLAQLAAVARFVDAPRSVSHIQAAIALVDERVDPVAAGLLYERLGRYTWIAGQGETAFEGYRTAADPRRGTEMITEVYVSREAFLPVVARVRKDFVEHKVETA